MLSDSWKSAFKVALKDPQKILLKSTKSMKLSSFFSDFRGLNYLSYQLFNSHFFLTFFYFGHKTPRGLTTWEN